MMPLTSDTTHARHPLLIQKVDYKWRLYGRAILKVEALLHMITLFLMGQLLSIMHNPRRCVHPITPSLPRSLHIG
jgi:hypothetical protein